MAQLERQLEEHRSAPAPADKKAAKKHNARQRAMAGSLDEAKEGIAALDKKIATVNDDPQLSARAGEYPDIGERVLAETARLHAGDEENRRLWEAFLPPCRAAIDHIYDRLDVRFDHTLGESSYHALLSGVVESLVARGIAKPGEGGAIGVFDERWPSPLLIQKQDGAFLYATTDLATIQYRARQWSPDDVLYVVDHRQSLHFEQLFAAARRWDYDAIRFVHVSFGTVLGDDGRPFKTRSGETVGLEALLDEAQRRALEVVCNKDDEKPDGRELSDDERRQIAPVVGLGALKYADLVQNRTSDYVFSYDKMLALNGNTATYMQYVYARVKSIFRRGEIDIERLRGSGATIQFSAPAERALGLELLRLAEALEAAAADFRPNLLTAYLFELAGKYSVFYEKCPVLKEPDPDLRASRLLLCDLTARTIALGLDLLGIGVVEKM